MVVGKCRGLDTVDRRSPKQMSAENTSRPTTTPSNDEPPALPSESSAKQKTNKKCQNKNGHGETERAPWAQKLLLALVGLDTVTMW